MELIERFKEFLSENSLSASQLADNIGVQKSSISHILSGRNKPSLDFVIKLLKHYPSLDIYWLLNGKPRNNYKANDGVDSPNKDSIKEDDSFSTSLFDQSTEKKQNRIDIKNTDIVGVNNLSESVTSKKDENSSKNSSKMIRKVVILYDDNSFEEYKPS